MHPSQTSMTQRGSEPNASTTEDELAQLSASLNRLVHVAASQGRDRKLIDALLWTIISLMIENDGKVFESEALAEADVWKSDDADDRTRPRKLSASSRSCLDAVIDSWSDDEAAEVLGIGLRHLRKRAQHGDLYYFVVHEKRRYPMWQFALSAGLTLPAADIVASIPEGWRPEDIYQFMTSPNRFLLIGGRSITPVEWLRAGFEPSRVAFVMRDSAQSRS